MTPEITFENLRDLYRLFDPDNSRGCFQVSWSEAPKWNSQNWGVFWTVNQFNGTRTKEHCVKILSWAVDIDAGSLAEQQELIKSFLEPSMVVQTKRGYQAYYNAMAGTADGYKTILEDHLIPSLNADRRAADISRILRVPHFYHCKNPHDRVICKLVSTTGRVYSEDDIRRGFPKQTRQEEISEERTKFKKAMRTHGAGDQWEKIWDIDCEEGLLRISGTEAMGMESISFKRAPRGCLNIYINGKGTSCWVDAQKKIGSKDRGGPGMAQWINWYHKDYSTTLSMLKKYFPEVFK